VTEKGHAVLQYTVISVPINYDLNSPEALELIQMLDDVTSNKFFESPIIKHIIDYFWTHCKRSMWVLLVFYLVPICLLTTFSVLRVNYKDEASNVLIPLVVFNFLLILMECIQAIVHFQTFLTDPWNYIDFLFIVCQLVMAVLFWADSAEEPQALFTSFSLVLAFTKLLVVLRVVDQLRYLIRMILEILRDMISFMTVILVYILSFSLVMYHSRNGQAAEDNTENEQNFGSVLLEMYTLIYGGWDDTNYSGTTMPFFILVTFLQALVLLNLIIAIMGDTYDRVLENLPTVDARERLSLIYEICVLKVQLRKVLRRFPCVKRRNNAAVGVDPNEDYFSDNKRLLLVIQPFENEDQAAVASTGEWAGKIKELKKDFQKSFQILRDDVANTGLKQEMSHNFMNQAKEIDTLKSEAQWMKSNGNKLQDTQADLLKKQEDLIKKVDDLASQIQGNHVDQQKKMEVGPENLMLKSGENKELVELSSELKELKSTVNQIQETILADMKKMQTDMLSQILLHMKNAEPSPIQKPEVEVVGDK